MSLHKYSTVKSNNNRCSLVVNKSRLIVLLMKYLSFHFDRCWWQRRSDSIHILLVWNKKWWCLCVNYSRQNQYVTAWEVNNRKTIFKRRWSRQSIISFAWSKERESERQNSICNQHLNNWIVVQVHQWCHPSDRCEGGRVKNRTWNLAKVRERRAELMTEKVQVTKRQMNTNSRD
jgi:hypothetical protein